MKWRYATFQKKNSDSEDNSAFQENNGEDVRNVNQRPTRTKEQANQVNNILVGNQQQNN